MSWVHIIAETCFMGLPLTLGLFLFGGFRIAIVQAIGAVFLLFFFFLLMGAVHIPSEFDPILGTAVAIFYAPLGLLLAFLRIGFSRAR